MEGNGTPLQQNTTGGKGVTEILTPVFNDLTKVYVMTKEVREETDSLEALKLLQTQKWVIANAFIQSDGQICWIMLRVA